MKYLLILLLLPINLFANECDYGIVVNGYEKYAEEISDALCQSKKFSESAFILSVENFKNGWCKFTIGNGYDYASGYCRFNNKKWKLIFCFNSDSVLTNDGLLDKYNVPKFIR